MFMFILALALAAGVIGDDPEFGFGAALGLCLGMPLAHWLDRPGWATLHFPANPGQTLIGHLGLILTFIIACGWSLHIYVQVGWLDSILATTLAAICASMARAVVPHPFNLPVIVTTVAGVLWAL